MDDDPVFAELRRRIMSARTTLLSLFPPCVDPHYQGIDDLAEAVAVRFIARGITIERLQAEIKALKSVPKPEPLPSGYMDDGYPV